MVKLSIVIPTKNEEEYLPILLRSIKKQTMKEYEIIVADADSLDKTREIARKQGCRIIKGGYPDEARNNGFKYCKADLILFIDSDILLEDKDFFKKALEEIRDKDLDIAGVLLRPIKTFEIFRDFKYRVFYSISNSFGKIFQNTGNPLMQACMFVSKGVMKKVKFPNYEFGEDSAFAAMAVALGYSFGLLRNVGKVRISPRRLRKKGFIVMILSYIYFNGLRMLGHEFVRGKSWAKYFD